jgi:hypothetical protein
LLQLANRFRTEYPDYFQQQEIPYYRRADKELMEAFAAYRRLQQMEHDRGLANYTYWEVSSEYNSKPEALEARRHWYNASRRLRSDLRAATAEYAKAIPYWKKLLTKPRGLNPQMDFAFLLGVGPQTPMNYAVIVQPDELFLVTPYGLEVLVQEEIIETQEQYRKQRAKSEAGPLLVEATNVWEHVQAMGRQISVPASLAGPVAGLPVGMGPATVEWVEDVLGDMPGPLDPYLSRNLLLAKRAREDRRMPSPALADEVKMQGPIPQKPTVEVIKPE